MTIREYLTDKIEGFGLVRVTSSLLLDLSDKNKLNLDKDASEYSVEVRELAILSFVPELLLTLDSISENGFSVSRANTEDRIKTYYSFKCKEYDVEDKLNNVSSISNGSKFW